MKETRAERLQRLAAKNGWIGVDLDGTLAHYEGWNGHLHIGKPIAKMVDRVLGWILAGIEVRIVTARVWDDHDGVSKKVIERWCQTHLGQVIPVTCTKDYGMIELWDDRAVQVVENTGERADGAAE